MSQNKYKCSAKDVKKNEVLREKIPKKDVELCLEVEMDDEVREIITSPEKCASTLLDVTVIKPKDLDHVYYSQKATLSGDEVRNLIASMELEKQDKQKLIDKILSSYDPKSSGDYVKRKYVKKVPVPPRAERQRISSTDDTNSDLAYHYKPRPGKRTEIQHIYTTPKTYNDIKSIFACKNRNKYDPNEKPDKPCLCRNCAIVGVLTDSQKRPFITENLYDPRELLSSRKDSKDSKRKKCVNFKEDIDDHLECEYYFRHLSSKIRKLEERLSQQEEKSVPKDYFKRIIAKLVTHLSKITSYAGYESLYTRPKSKESKEPYKTKERYTNNKYCVHPVLVESKISKTEFDQLSQAANHPNPTEQYQQSLDGFWKWGEEILKPGIDLKNKIVMLLEETLTSLKKSKSVSSRVGKDERCFGDSLETPQKIPAEVPVRDVPNKLSSTCKNYGSVNNNNSGSTLAKGNNSRSCEKRGRRFLQSKQECFHEEMLDVSYLNPHVPKWQEESQISFKFDSSDVESLKYHEERKLNDTHKAEFRETLCNTKESDKVKLWNSVWTQAKLNGQNRDDKVTIQMPDKKGSKNRVVEIEYTIAELEDLLVGRSRSNHKQNLKKRK